jgi:hypothetical protein
MISAGGIDVLNVNHHGSESSTNINWMNLSRPAVAVIATGAGQSSTWNFPRIDVVEHVLRAGVSCVSVPPASCSRRRRGRRQGPSPASWGSPSVTSGSRPPAS